MAEHVVTLEHVTITVSAILVNEIVSMCVTAQLFFKCLINV